MFETEFSTVSLEGDVVFLRFKADAYIEVKEAKLIIENILRYYKGETLLVYTDASKLFSLTNESKRAFANKDLMDKVKKNAVYTESLGIRIIGTFFINFLKPGFPLQLFKSEEEALCWLNLKKEVAD